MSNDNHTDEQDLHDYLEGRDGVSETYGSLPDAEPPEALDALILARARASLEIENAQKTVTNPTRTPFSFSSPAYSVAASLFTFILIGALVYSRQDLPVTSPLSDMTRDTAESEGTQFSETTASSAETGERVVTERSLESTPLVTNIEISRQRSTGLPGSPAADTALVAGLEQAESVTITGSRLGVDTAAMAPQPVIQAEAEMLDEVAGRNELVISSASKADFDQPVLGQEFRLSAESWAEEIFYLRQEAEDANALLEEEMALFMQRFPDSDLELLLEQHQSDAGE